MRVAVFGSFYRGFYVLSELLFGPLFEELKVVGIATDDPCFSFVSPEKRVWQYPHTRCEVTMVGDLGRENGIPVYLGKVKCQSFYDIYENDWRPDLCVMATFGQRIDQRLISFPRLGFCNFHPSDIGIWPSRYAGSNPFLHMFKNGERNCVITLHEVDEKFDNGRRIATSDIIRIPPGVSVVDMHKISSPIAALLLRRELPKLLMLS
jgi:methionyl-tRNA formyltransferase